ncbi:MAG: hypothetical protein H6719_21425 [Sandaracinaceae bacterium]|nr:hypothetical protein [Sandaracinaceae bacterium]
MLLLAPGTAWAQPHEGLASVDAELARRWPGARRTLVSLAATDVPALRRALSHGRVRPNLVVAPLDDGCGIPHESWTGADANAAFRGALLACRAARRRPGPARWRWYRVRWAVDDDDFKDEGVGFLIVDPAEGRALVVERLWHWFER